jgi:hypothetical protein
MSDNATSSLKVKPLDDNNWFTFCPAMTACFQQRGLWRVITGNILPPPIPVYFVATRTLPAPLTAQEVMKSGYLSDLGDQQK